MSTRPIKLGKVGKGGQGNRIYSIEGKAVTQTANSGGIGSNTGLYAMPLDNAEKAATVQKINSKNNGSMVASSCVVNKLEKFLNNRNQIYEVKNNFITIKDKEFPINLVDGYYIIRKLTVKECERLQTLPDGYCSNSGVSNSQCYKGIGNGWTAEVIIHLLDHALKDIPKDTPLEVLSLYDGIGTGRYCLDKMGFTNVKYKAYEIDKYAKQIANYNYQDIIQCGDAFQVREYDWKY